MAKIALDKVKIFYDQAGQPREVLMSYELFQQIEALLQEAIAKDDQGYFWTEAWQTRIREAEADIEAGRIRKTSAETVKSALEWLDE